MTGRVQLKLCGFTRLADVRAVAALAGVTSIGLNFWPGSRRHVDLGLASELAEAVRDMNCQSGRSVALVGLFVDQDLELVATTAAAIGLAAIQLHGDESPTFIEALRARIRLPIWKGVAIGGASDVTRALQLARHADAILLDAASASRGGSGKAIDWKLAHVIARAASVPVHLAGGISPSNVAAAIAAAAPTGIDIASGVESSPGVKDLAKVEALLAAMAAAAAPPATALP